MAHQEAVVTSIRKSIQSTVVKSDRNFNARAQAPINDHSTHARRYGNSDLNHEL